MILWTEFGKTRKFDAAKYFEWQNAHTDARKNIFFSVYTVKCMHAAVRFVYQY